MLWVCRLQSRKAMFPVWLVRTQRLRTWIQIIIRSRQCYSQIAFLLFAIGSFESINRSIAVTPTLIPLVAFTWFLFCLREFECECLFFLTERREPTFPRVAGVANSQNSAAGALRPSTDYGDSDSETSEFQEFWIPNCWIFKAWLSACRITSCERGSADQNFSHEWNSSLIKLQGSHHKSQFHHIFSHHQLLVLIDLHFSAETFNGSKWRADEWWRDYIHDTMISFFFIWMHRLHIFITKNNQTKLNFPEQFTMRGTNSPYSSSGQLSPPLLRSRCLLSGWTEEAQENNFILALKSLLKYTNQCLQRVLENNQISPSFKQQNSSNDRSKFDARLKKTLHIAGTNPMTRVYLHQRAWFKTNSGNGSSKRAIFNQAQSRSLSK